MLFIDGRWVIDEDADHHKYGPGSVLYEDKSPGLVDIELGWVPTSRVASRRMRPIFRQDLDKPDLGVKEWLSRGSEDVTK